MLEMSAAKSPALALTGAVTPAVPAAPSADGAQNVDFSLVLAGATLVGEAPAPMDDMLVQPEADTRAAPELLLQPANLPGKSGAHGNSTGKNLPAGKLPAARLATVTEKASRKLQNESAELHDESIEAAPEQDAIVASKSGEQASVQTDPTATALIDPMTAATVPASEMASNAILAAPTQDATAAQPTRNDTVAGSEPTLAKLQSRAPAQLQTKIIAAKAADVAVKPAAAKLGGTPNSEESAASAGGSVVRNQPLPLRGADRTTTSPEERAAPTPDARAIVEAVEAPRVESAANQPAAVRAQPATQAPLAHPPIAQPTIALAAIAPEPSPPATIPHLQTTAATPSAIVVAPAVARSSADPKKALLHEGAEPAPDPQNAPVLTRATVASLLAQTAPSALIPVAAPALTAASAIVELIAEGPATLAQATAPAVPALTSPDKSTEAAAGSTKAAILAATLPVAALSTPPASPAPSSDVVAQIKPVSVATPSELAQAPAVTSASLAATPTSVPMIEPAAIVSPAPAAQDRSSALASPAQPLRNEAAVTAPVLAAGDKDHKAASTAVSSEATMEAPALVARAPMDASTLAAEFRSAPSAPIATTSSTVATPTQDIAALVDRITEARAAASPHTIRASLVHEDFGAVSVNLRTDASHIHVTLGSADAGFAPAVQAAAAASLSGNGTGSDDANARREAPTPQQFTSTQDTATRADTSSQQHAARDRAPAPERSGSREAPGRQAHASAEREPSSPASRRRGGIYA